MNGTVLDYDTSLISKGFVFNNPERQDDLRLREFLRRLTTPPRARQVLHHEFQHRHPPVQICRTCGGGAPVDVHFCPSCTKILTLGRHGDYFSFLGVAAEAESRSGAPRTEVPHAEPAVPSRLLLQRHARRAPRQPRALLVSERRVPDTEAASIAGRRTCSKLEGALKPSDHDVVEEGSGIAARGSVRTERRARRSARHAQRRRARGRNGARGWPRQRNRSKQKRAEHESQLRELFDRWDALAPTTMPAGRASVLAALRDRVLERNYINNLLATIEREADRHGTALSSERAGIQNSEAGSPKSMQPDMSKVVGIDLGTTNSLVAFVQRRRAVRHPRQGRRCRCCRRSCPSLPTAPCMWAARRSAAC